MLEVVTPSPTADLTVLATVKEELRITDTSQDAYLERLIDEASEAITEACNRMNPDGTSAFGRATYKQTERPRYAADFLLLDRDILPSISSVALNGTNLTTDDWEIDGFHLYRLFNDCRICWYAWSKIEITYDAGYTLVTNLPRPLERACLDLVVSTYQARGRDVSVSRRQTEGVGTVSYFDVKDWRHGFPPGVQGVIDRWRRVPV